MPAKKQPESRSKGTPWEGQASNTNVSKPSDEIIVEPTEDPDTFSVKEIIVPTTDLETQNDFVESLPTLENVENIELPDIEKALKSLKVTLRDVEKTLERKVYFDTFQTFLNMRSSEYTRLNASTDEIINWAITQTDRSIKLIDQNKTNK